MSNDQSEDQFGDDLFDGVAFEERGNDPDTVIRMSSTTDEAIDAGGGNDVILTGSGNDIVKGGEGSDYISTGAGEDILMGGPGSNILSGGNDADTFLFDTSALGPADEYALNTVTDFNPQEDCIRLVGFDIENAADIPSFVTASGLMLQLAPNKILLLQGITSMASIVDAIDLGGDPDPVAPTVTVALQNDSGTVDDFITSNIDLTGTVTGDAAVTGLFVVIDGGTEIDVSAGLDGVGGFAFGADLLGALAQGAHTFILRAVDANGLSSDGTEIAVTLDTIAPEITDLVLDPDADTGTPGDGKTAVGTDLVLRGITDAGTKVSLGDVTVIAGADGRFAIEAGAAVLGVNSFELLAMDDAGNTSSETIDVIGETSDLPVPDVTAALSNDSGSDATDGITNDLALSGSVSFTPTTFTIAVGDGVAIDITAELSDDNSFALTQDQVETLFGNLAEGAVTFTLRATNADGVAGNAAVVAVTYDATGPNTQLDLAEGSDSGVVGDNLTNFVLVDVIASFLDAVAVRFGTQVLTPDTDGTVTLTDLELDEGDNTITVIGEDAAGNTDTDTIVITVDTTAPDISGITLDENFDTGTVGDNTTDLRLVTLRGQAEVGATVSLGALSTVVGDDGIFALTGVPIAIGANAISLTATDAAGNSATAGIDITGTSAPVGDGSPVITAFGLVNDTGIDDEDGQTTDAALSGNLSGDAPITGLSIQVNGGVPFDASNALSGETFTLTTAILTQAAGGDLPDGAFSVTLTATDAGGRSSPAQTFAGTLDTGAPDMQNLALAASSDTGLRGDGITALRAVKIVGEGEAGATVFSGDARTLVGNDGKFALDGVAVAVGDNDLTLTIVDIAGNTFDQTLEVTGIQSTAGQPVLVWNDITLEAIADNADTPTGASRILAMQSVAVHDVVAAIDGAPAFLAVAAAGVGADLSAAIAQASWTVLSYAFPAFQDELDAYLAQALADVPDGADEDAGVALGQAIADRVIAIRSTDGWDDFETVSGSEVAGQWRETGPMFNPAADPHWATMDTWALDDQDQFRADAPPALTSAEYAASVASVQAIGSADSTTRTDDQTEAARFWKDGLGTETTPGHWNSIATDLMKDYGAGSGAAARALAMLNVSIADAMIAAWDTKYTHRLWRPEDAIRLANEDGNAATVADLDWTPMMLSPAHPDFVSGHAAASGAAAQALTSLFGTQSFTTESLGLNGVTRSFGSFWEAAEENAESREWGGIHYDFSNEVGLSMGADVAQWAIDAFNSQTDTAAPTIITDVSVGFAKDLPFGINGVVLDTLSGVETLAAVINDGDTIDVAFDDDGNFEVAFDASTPDGTYDIALTATDAAGNTSKVVTSQIVIDTADPTLTLTSLTDGGLEGTAARLTGTIDGTGAPIVALAYQIDGGKVYSLAFNQKTGVFDSAINLSSVSAGAATISIIAADAAGNSIREDVALTLDEDIAFIVTSVSPDDDADEVGSTFRPEVHFSRAVDPDTVTKDSFYVTDASGNVLDAAVKVSADGQKAWAFLAEPMPGANTISINLRGDLITALDGTPLDGDADGTDGGNMVSTFQTVSTVGVAGTSLIGFVVDPGNDLKPMTVDDYSAGADAVDYTDDDVFLSPIEGAKVFILGREGEFVFTDAEGRFELTNIPSGNVKVAIEGRTATNAPDGIFWPEMVMDTTIIAGQENTLMASQGSVTEREAVEGRGEVYLPRVQSDILQTLSDTEETEIDVIASAAQDLTAQQRDAIRLVVQPGTAVDENGEVIADAQVGIATVPPELVMDMLPAGIMQHTFDLTIQAPDAAVFTTPAELTLPNVFDAAPGTKLNLLSFDHTTGRLVIEGTGTVSADGLTVTTDPGTGITKPGWHGMAPPGGCGGEGGAPEGPEEPTPEDTEQILPDEVVELIVDDGQGSFFGVFGAFDWEMEWEAKDALEDSEDPAPSDDECAPPAPPEDTDQKQPDLKVKIEIDGPLKDFLEATGDIPINSAVHEFTLRAGTGESKTLELEAKSFEDIITGGMKKIEQNMLFGSKVTITEELTNPDGSKAVTIKDIYFTRYIDATDDEHEDGKTEFSNTLHDGVKRELDLKVMGGAGLKVEVADASEFQTTNTKLTFDPTSAGEKTTELKFKYDNGVEVSQTIELSGKGYDPESYSFDETTFEAISSSLLDATKYPNIIQAQKDLLSTEVKRDGILADIGTKTQEFFDDAGLKGISEASGSDAHKISFLDGRSKVVTNADGSQSYGLGGATGAFSSSDIDFDEIIELYGDKADYSTQELSFRASEIINNNLGGNIAFYLDNFFISTSESDTTGELKNALGHNSAHEIGHHLGLLHTFQWSTGLLHAGGADDVMSQGVFASDTQSFDESLEAAKVALHNSYTPAEALAALKYYNTINTTSAGYVTGINNSYGDIGESDTGSEPFVLIDGPAIDVTYVDGPAVFGQIDFGQAAVDGSMPSVTIKIENYGNQTAHISSISTTNSAFSIDAGTLPFELVAGAFRFVTVEMNADFAGEVDGVLQIESNATSNPLEFDLGGTVVSSDATLTLTSDNSNLGGVDRGEAAADADMFTITNNGLTDLVVDAITMGADAASFALSGLPADFATTPITLATGEAFTFGVTFTGIAAGISRGEITISSNDPAHPTTTVAAMATSYDGLHYFDWGNDYIAIDIDGETLRTQSDENGSFEFFLPPEADYTITVFDPDSGLIAINYGTTAISGRGTDLTSGLVFRPATGEDKDFDGLSVEMEHAIGTSDINADSNADGISDFDAIVAGLTPLDPFSTNLGVVRTLELQGEVRAMFATRDLTEGADASEPLLVVTSMGLAVVDVTDPREPTLTAFTALTGITEAAYDPVLKTMILVNTDGDAISYDVSDPTDPVETSVLADSASKVVVVEGFAVIATANVLRLFEIATGDELDTAALSNNSSVRGMTSDGTAVYALDSSGRLTAFEVLGDDLIKQGTVSVGVNSADRQLFTADGVVYVPATNGFQGGYLTVDVSNPNAPELISGVDDASIGGTAIALNGAGRGLAVGDPGGVFGVNAIDVVSTSDPDNTSDLITRYEIDSKPTDVLIAAGVGYVGTADGKLHIVNFQPFDTSGVAPVVTLLPSALDIDPDTAGVQILEGGLLALDAVITDDAGLRSVSLLVNGDPIRVDLSYPFDLFAAVPLLDEGEDSRAINLQVRATDTGGNVGLSDVIEAQIVPDTIPPKLLDANVDDGALYGRSKRSFTLTFDEPLDPDTDLQAAIQLTGPSGLVIPDTIVLRSSDRAVAVTYPELEEGTYTLTLVSSEISDVAGNAIAGADQLFEFDLGTFSNEWTGEAGDGLWSNADNWTTGEVPNAEDDIFVGNLTGPVTLYNLGDVQLKSLVAEAEIVIGYNTNLITEFDVIADEVSLTNYAAAFTPGTIADVDILNVQAGTVGGDAIMNIGSQLNWTSGTFQSGGLLKIENGAQAQFGTVYDPEVESFSQQTLYLYRDILIEGDGIVGGAYMRLGTRTYDSELGAYVYEGGKVTVAEGASLEFTNYRADMVLNYTGDDVAGVENLGVVRKTGGGTSTIIPHGESLGTVEILDGFLAIGNGSTLVISEGDDLTGLLGLKIDGGTLMLEGDVTLTDLSFSSGTIQGDGTLTLAGDTTWTGGILRGEGKVVIPEDAHLMMGQPYNPETYNNSGSISLYRELEISGTADHGSARINLGDRYYDSELGQYVAQDAPIRVLSGAEYTFSSPFATMTNRYPTFTTETGLNNEGGVIKTGGGASGVTFFGEQTGTFDFVDGTLEISGGNFVLTQALIDAGFDNILISGGVVTLDTDVTMTGLQMSGGTLSGEGSLDVTALSWRGGEIALDGGVTIPEDGTVSFGQQYYYNTARLGGIMTVNGTFDGIEGRNLYMGGNFAQDDGTTTLMTGILQIAGTMSVGTSMQIYDGLNNGTDLSGVTGTGTLVKTGGGTSNLLLQGFDGTIDEQSGQFTFDNGYSTIDAGTVLAGLTDLVVGGGNVIIDGDLTFDNITLNAGRIDGDGTLTVTEQFDWLGGYLSGDGTLDIANGAQAQFGYQVEESTSTRTLYLAREIAINGDATYGNANLYLGRQDYDYDLAQYVIQGGYLTVEADGTLDFRNTSGSIFATPSYFEDGDQIGLVNKGSVTATYGDGPTQIAMAQNTGSFVAQEGRFTISQGTFEIDENTQTNILDIAEITGGTVFVATDTAIDHLTLRGGELRVDADLTLDDSFIWLGGNIVGNGGVIVASGATAQFGTPGSNPSLFLRANLDIAGNGTLDGGTLRLGDYTYDSDLAQYINAPGQLSVSAGGVFRLVGEDSDINVYRFTGTNENTFTNNGTVIKSGGGVSNLANNVILDGAGVYLTEDGVISIGSGAVLTLTSGSNLSAIQLDGGTLVAADDVSIADLTVNSGVVTGGGDLTVTNSFVQFGGALTGDGALILSPDATGLFGQTYDGTGGYTNRTAYVGRDVLIEGDATIDQATLRMGQNTNPDAGTTVIVAVGATLTFEGPNTRIDSFYSGTTSPNMVVNNGTIVKTGDGTSVIDSDVVMTGFGTITAVLGEISTADGTVGVFTPPAVTPIYADVVVNSDTRVLTAAEGVTEITVTSGILRIDEDITLTNLSMTGGQIQGDGKITITGAFDWQAGTIASGGDIVVASTADLMLGLRTNVESASLQSLYLGRTLQLDGDGLMEQARLYLGTSNGGVVSAGILEISDGATLDTHGYSADIYRSRDGSDGTLSQIIVDGVLTKTGGGETEFRSLPMSGNGTIAQQDGTLRLNSDTLTFDQSGSTLIGDLTINGGRLVIDSDTDVSGLTSLTLTSNAQLDISGTVTLDTLTVLSGRINNTGTLTVTDTLDMAGGSLWGGGETIIAGSADATLGTQSGVQSVQIGQTLTVEGAMTVETAYVYLGSREYDAGAAAYITHAGIVQVDGTLTLNGNNANLTSNYTEIDKPNTVTVDGILIKDGGGSSTVQAMSLGDAASVQIIDGTLSFQSGTIVLTQALVDAGLTSIALSGATLEISEDITLPELTMAGGILTGDGTLTISDNFTTSYGGVQGTGGLIIAEGATAQMEGNYYYNNDGQRDITVDGELSITGTFYLGGRTYDDDAGAYIYSGGLLTVSDTGVLTVQEDGAIYYSYTPPTDQAWGVSSTGMIISNTAELRLPLIDESTGTMELNGGVLVLSNGDFVLTQALVDAGITGIRLEGGSLIIDDTVTLPRLELINGTIQGDGDLTVTENFEWLGGTMQGTGDFIAAASADVQFGYDSAVTTSTGSANLSRTLTIEGEADFGGLRLNLGQRGDYDSTTGEYDYHDGNLAVASGAALNINSINGSITRNYPTIEGELSGVINDGAIIKSGGGIFAISIAASTGTYDFNDGVLSLSDSVLPFTQDLVDAGFDQIVVQSGTFSIAEALSVDNVVIEGGELLIDAGLTITGTLDWKGGTIATGDQTLTLAEGSITQIGEPFDPEIGTNYQNVYLRGDIDIAGDVLMGQVRMGLGQSFYDYTLNSYVTTSGTIDILSTGTLEMNGPGSDFYDATFVSGVTAAHQVGINNAGTLIKTGFGVSDLPLYGDNTGVFDQRSGQFGIIAATLDGEEQALSLTAEMVANGLDVLLVKEGVVTTVSDLTFAQLSISDSGLLLRDTDITVTESYVQSGGGLVGSGLLTIADGATALFGATTIPDQYNGFDNLLVTGDVDILGTARIERAQLSLGAEDGYDYVGGSDGEGDTFVFYDAVVDNDPGNIAVGEGGTLEFFGPYSDIVSASDTDVTSGISNAGDIVKLGDGTAAISDVFAFESTGTITLLGGAFDAPGDEFDFGI